jgi:glycerol-3-phosphate O-acyltransferase / dihydroxyacetone phosphate acyltransferase
MIKRGLYNYLKFLVRFSFGIFYRPTVVLGKERLQLQGPTILATNHPNTLVDALNAAGRANQIVHFLVNASLYSSTIGRRFFDYMFCIPVKRRQDPSVSGVDNSDSFARCYEHFLAGGHLFIAPEGGSEAGRRLRPIKRGTAHMVMGAYRDQPEAQPVRILPIGLNYQYPNRFGSYLVVNVGEPILNTDYAEQFETNPRAAINQLTKDLEDRLRSTLIHTRSSRQDEALTVLENLLQAQQPVPLETHFHRARLLIRAMQDWENRDPEGYQAFEAEVCELQQKLRALKLTEETLIIHQERAPRAYWGLFAGLPLYLFGYLNNLFAAGIPSLLSRSSKIDREYEATVQILLGLLTFPLFYLVQSWLLSSWLGMWGAIAYGLSLLPAGIFAWHYRQYWKRHRSIYRFKNLSPTQQLVLIQQKDQLMERIQQFVRDGVA